MDVALRRPEPWFWIAVGLVWVFLVVVPGFLILVGSGIVPVEGAAPMSGPGLALFGLVMVAGVGILVALLWDGRSGGGRDRAGRALARRRKTG